jgi:hypothetical protein
MKTILMAVVVANLTGCAAMYNRQDLCQNYYKVANYEYPSHCGSSTRIVTRDYYTNKPLTTTRIER